MEIPKEIKNIIATLKQNNFNAYVVGGCVRDLFINKKPGDWDITTNAKPNEIKKIFPKSFYENKFFTVTVLTESAEPTLKEIEITTFRAEAKYFDKRHPEKIEFAQTLNEDLKRRDFTINALALKIEDSKIELIDLFEGMKDLKNKIIRAIGNAEERFNEDALRLMRAIRLATVLGDGWQIEENTFKAIQKNAHLIKEISQERIRDEFIKIINCPHASQGIELLRISGLLKNIIPEIEEGYKITQNKHHIYDCYEHYLKSLDYAVKKNFNTNVRISALFHDIGKPRVKNGEGLDSTFYNHEIVGAKMTFDILTRLKFPKKDIKKITTLVRYHLFYYNPGEVKEKSIRRLVRNVGIENMEELLEVRMADRIGSGVPKAEPYKLRHLKYMIEKVSKDPISVKMLKINGNEIMKILNIEPGPKIGAILDILLGNVLDDPQKNEKKFLMDEVKKLGNLDEQKLKALAEKARQERENVENKEDKTTKERYWVS